MEIFAFLFALVALVAFLFAAFNYPAKLNLIAVGLFFLNLAWIVELVTSGRQVHS